MTLEGAPELSGQFLDFARLQDVHIASAHLEADGRIHRADVGDGPSGKNDASYLLRPDGTGWVLNFKADGKPALFKPELARELTPQEKADIEARREDWRKQQVERRVVAIRDAVGRWERSHDPAAFPYLQAPKLEPAGLRRENGQLLVPMLAVHEDGELGWVGAQRITWAKPGQSADKRFIAGTPTEGAFAVIPIIGTDVEAPLRAFETACRAETVAICEGIGTALAIHQATGLPVIAAMSAQNLPNVARSLHDQLQGRAVIFADNDGEKAQFKGQAYAAKAARILGEARAAIALPTTPNGITPPGYDARDQLRDAGAAAVRSALDRAMPAQQLERLVPTQFLLTQKPGLRSALTQAGQAISPTQEKKTMDQPIEQRRATDIERGLTDPSSDTGREQLAAVTKAFNQEKDPDRRAALQSQIKILRAQIDGAKPDLDAPLQQPKVPVTEPAPAGDSAVTRTDVVNEEVPAMAPDDIGTPEPPTVSAPTERVVTSDAFDEINQAADKAEAEATRPKEQETEPRAATPEDRLLLQWRATADPVREQRAKAQYDLEAKHREQRETMFGSLDQLRADKHKELGGMADEHKASVIAMEVAKQVEKLQKQQAADRKTLQSSLPDVPSYKAFLEQRAPADPEAARLLEIEKRQSLAPLSVKGKRVAPVEPSVLDGLTHEIDDTGPNKSIHYLRDNERVMTDHGNRVDLMKMDDREIESALRLAEQKFDMNQGLNLTGSREFQERAAEIAGRMGLKIQNEDLQKTWQQGRLTALQADELGITPRPVQPIGGIGQTAEVAPRRRSLVEPGGNYVIDYNHMAAEAVLAHLHPAAWDTLRVAGRGQSLTPDQRAQLCNGVQSDLVDDKNRLTPLGQATHDLMVSKIKEEESQMQQALRTRNVDEDLAKKDHDKALKAGVEVKAEEKTLEAVAAAAVVEHETEKEQERKAPEISLPTSRRVQQRDVGPELG